MGVIVFFAAHTGREGAGGIEETQSGIQIVAEMYGGCEIFEENRCPSFRIENDGSYTYINRGH